VEQDQKKTTADVTRQDNLSAIFGVIRRLKAPRCLVVARKSFPLQISDNSLVPSYSTVALLAFLVEDKFHFVLNKATSVLPQILVADKPKLQCSKSPLSTWFYQVPGTRGGGTSSYGLSTGTSTSTSTSTST
jgi:hypothetical protein